MSFLLNAGALSGIDPIYLILAIGMILVVGFYIYKTKNANNGNNPEQNADNITASPAANDKADCLDEEIVAVIAAAIEMAESESNGLKFRVVSFRRI